MKVLLTAINAKYIHSNLAVRYLKEYTKELDYECKISEFSINDRIENIFEKIMCEAPDVVAFSCYIWNIEYVKKLANLIKTLNDRIEIVYGGPEVSYDSKSFLQSNPGEYVIEGEGEETFKEFIQCKISDMPLKNIRGLYYKANEKVNSVGQRELMDMNKIRFPYKSDEVLKGKMVYYEASRGCPFSCKYCLSSTIHGVRFLNLERVKKELQYFIDKEVRIVKFVDRTFNCNSKFAMGIWEFLIDAQTDATFHFEISADLLKPEELELLSAAPKGRIQFEVGVQTTDNKVLENIDRHVNFNVLKEKIIELEKLKNIHQHLDLIAGLPGEDYETFKKSFNDVYSIKPEVIQLGFLKLLKGSAMREEAEKWGMVYSPYAPYEIFKTNCISYEEILKLKKVEEVLDKYYNSNKFMNILKYLVPKFETPFDFYYSLGEFFKAKGYFDRSISSADYYKVFIEFAAEILEEDTLQLAEIIKFDYLKYNKKKWLPVFLNRVTDKQLDRKIREKLKTEGIFKAGEDFHIEQFSIDVLKFEAEGKIVEEQKYVVFDEKNVDNIFNVK